MKILVFRESGEFSRILTESGFEVCSLPLIETFEINDLSDFETKLAAIENYDGVFLTSAKAAKVFRAKLTEKEIIYRGKIYVLGRRAFDILKTEKLDLLYDESANTAREMLEKIAPEDLKNKHFLFVRGEQSLRVVPDFLAKRATIDETIVYTTRNSKIVDEQITDLRDKFAAKEIAAACFFSPSAGKSFIEQFGAEILHQTIIAAIGKTTADFFEQRNFPVGFVSPKASAENFAVELINYLKEDLPTKETKEAKKRRA